jgi:hypothetical protein
MTRVFVVAVARFDRLARVAPVGILASPLTNVGDKPRDRTRLRDLREPDVDEMVDVARDERLRLHRRPKLCGVNRRPVMTDLGRLFGEAGGERRISRRDDRPAVDKNLRADLLRDGLAVDRDRAARRRLDAAPQVEPGCVLGRFAVAAPPQDRAILDDVVEPGFADLTRRDVGSRAMVLESANEGKRAGNVIVGDDERAGKALVHIVLDRTKLVHDPLIGPTLERAPEIDADQLAEHRRIGALGIVLRKGRHRG